MDSATDNCNAPSLALTAFVPIMAGDKSTDNSTSRSQPNLQDPVETIQWGGNLPSRRRAITGGLSGLAISMSLRLNTSVPAMHCHTDSEVAAAARKIWCFSRLPLCDSFQHLQ